MRRLRSLRPKRSRSWSPTVSDVTMLYGRFAGNEDLRNRPADHPNNTQFTPSYILDPVRVDLGGVIGLDPCTTPDNPVGATRFYTPVEDGLARSWFPTASVYCN